LLDVDSPESTVAPAPRPRCSAATPERESRGQVPAPARRLSI